MRLAGIVRPLCVSPPLWPRPQRARARRHYLEETLSTLNYASRAKNIRNRPIVQMDPKEQLIAGLRHDIQLLRAENHHLRLQLKAGACRSRRSCRQLGKGSAPLTPRTLSSVSGRGPAR